MNDYRARLLGRLAGFSDRAMDQHVALYEAACRELAAIQGARSKLTWTVPPGALSLPPGDIQRVLDTPIALLPLSLEAGRLGSALARLRAETTARGLTFWPGFYLGDDDFWTTDRATSVNLPWYLGSEATWVLVNERRLKLTEDDVLRILRHEYAHALLYAYRGWEAPGWREAFGDFDAPYQDAYDPDPARERDFVRHLGRPGPGQLAHYAQKHPDEDWAETFAVWLAGGWEEEYLGSTGELGLAPYPPGSLAPIKLAFVGRLVVGQGAFYGDPVVRAQGRRTPCTTQTGTVGEYLGQVPGFSEHAALLRREPEVFGAVRLHELYFENLAPPGQVAGEGFAAAAGAYGGLDAWGADFRAIGGSTDGWALACWDPRAGRLRNALVRGDTDGIPPGCPILLAMDCHGHAFALDHGATGKHVGLAAFLRCVDWAEVDRRLYLARGAFALVPAASGGYPVAVPIPVGPT